MLSARRRAGRSLTAGPSCLSTADSILMSYPKLSRHRGRRDREDARGRWQRPYDFPILPLGNIGGSAGHEVTTAMTGLTRTTRHEPGCYESTTGMRVSQRGACHTETERRHGDAVRVAEPPYP